MKLLDTRLKIAALIALLLLVGMLLLDMVMVFASQKLLIKSEREKGAVLVALIGAHMLSDQAGWENLPAAGEEGGLLKTLEASNIVGAVWMDPGGETHWIMTGEDVPATKLEGICRAAGASKSLQTDAAGSTWGIFWRQNKYLILAGPCFEESGAAAAGAAGAAGVAMRMDPVFSDLRRVQKFIGYYLLINTLLLSLVGILRIHSLTLRPVLKIIGRAESFRPGDSAFSLEESGESEVARLSRAINRVFDLNREDQEALKRTVIRLEEAMAQLKRAQQEIIQAEKLATVGRLSSGVAHEIGNPIGIVMGYLELIKQGVGQGGGGNDEILDYIRRAEDEILRIRGIIRQLLDYSRPSDANPKSLAIHRVLEEVIDMARVQPVFSDIAVAAELDAGCDTVSGHADQLKQLFLNFILNAADAIKTGGKDTGGRILVASENFNEEKPGGESGRKMIRVRFEDNGSGIPEADLNRIFDPFFTTKPTGVGSGLGLWVSLLIAESMGGSIEVRSRQGEGTRMALVVPAGGEGLEREGERPETASGR